MKKDYTKAFFILIDQAGYSLTNFFIGVIAARTCGIDGYGIYILSMTLITTFIGFQASLSGTPFTVFNPQKNTYNQKLYLGSNITICLIISALIIMISSIVILTWIEHLSYLFIFGFSGCAIVFIFRDFLRYVFLSMKETKPLFLLGLSTNCTIITTTCIAYYLTTLNIDRLLIIITICLVLPIFAALYHLKNEMSFSTKDFNEHIKVNIFFGKWPLISQILLSFIRQCYPWLLGYFCTIKEVGEYGIYLSLSGLVRPFLLGLGSWFGPKSAEILNKKGGNFLNRFVIESQIALAIILSIYLLIISIYGKQLIHMIFGNQYHCDTLSLLFISIAVSIIGILVPVQHAFNATKMPKIRTFGLVIATLLSIIIGVPLVSIYGVRGAAGSFAIVRVVEFIWTNYQWVKNNGAYNSK